jgi:non-ribosomal peptide synthetase component E (peptide arylation enzyme)
MEIPFEFVEELPLTALGKVDKASLRAPFWTGLDRAVN